MSRDIKIDDLQSLYDVTSSNGKLYTYSNVNGDWYNEYTSSFPEIDAWLNKNALAAASNIGYGMKFIDPTDPPTSQGDDNVKFNPSKLSYELAPGKIVIHNKDSYTRQWSIEGPDKVAKAIKERYRSKYGTDLKIGNESLELEIYMHAVLSNYKILSSHTDNADCGDNVISKDGNRWIWDTWWRMVSQPVYMPY